MSNVNLFSIWRKEDRMLGALKETLSQNSKFTMVSNKLFMSSSKYPISKMPHLSVHLAV